MLRAFIVPCHESRKRPACSCALSFVILLPLRRRIRSYATDGVRHQSSITHPTSVLWQSGRWAYGLRQAAACRSPVGPREIGLNGSLPIYPTHTADALLLLSALMLEGQISDHDGRTRPRLAVESSAIPIAKHSSLVRQGWRALLTLPSIVSACLLSSTTWHIYRYTGW